MELRAPGKERAPVAVAPLAALIPSFLKRLDDARMEIVKAQV